MRRIVLLLAVFLSITSLAMAQTTVTGTVKDESGNPVPFATVSEKGAQNAVSADAQGIFHLNVKAGTTLEISATGFESQEVKATSEPMSVILKSGRGQTIDEVVVTALGVSREKRALGYATQSLKADQLVEAANTSFAGALQGKVSGVDIVPSSGMPGASTLITIRGARSFTGDNSPLYVVDGMPISSGPDLSTGNSVTGTDYANRGVDIDPNDIANVEILKGQAASALYGIRASNGVVLITTKSGKGAAKGRPQISFNSTVSFDRISRYPELQSTYAQGSNGAFNPTASTSYGPKISDLPKDPNYGGETDNDYTAADGKHPGMYYVPQRAQAGLDPWVTPAVYDNVKEFFNTGLTFNNSIGVVNATDKGSYALSLASTNQTGIVPKTGMDRYNAKLAAETMLSDHFKVGFSGNFVNSNIKKAPSANDGLIATVYPAPPSYDLAGIPSHADGDLYTPVGYRGGTFVNPYWGVENNTFTEQTNRFFGNGYLTYNTRFSDKTTLDVKYQLGTDAYTTNYEDIWGFGSPSRSSSITQYSFTNTSFNSLLTGNLKWDISNDFKFTALVGNEFVNQVTDYKSQYGQDFAFGGWNHMDNTGTKDATSTFTKYRTIGTFANISLSYLNMLYLGLTGRYDRVSSMPSKNRDFFYPSASLGFVFTELNGLKNGSVVNYGKLRFSVAQVGQAGTYLPNYYSIPAYGGGFYSITPIFYPIGENSVKAYIPSTTIYDPNLKPQNTNSFEIGTDLNFFNNLIELNYTYSRQDVRDQIFAIPLAGSTGANNFMTNGGKIHTNAHEATINANIIRHRDLEWSLGVNFSKIDNYVDELAPEVESIFLGGFTTPQVRAGIGDKFPVIYGTKYKRNDKGQIIYGDDGIPLVGEDGVIGVAAPDFILGGNTRLRYKNFTFSAVVEWKSGGQQYSGTTNLLDNYGASKLTADARDKNEIVIKNALKEDGTVGDIKIEGYKNIQAYYQNLNTIDESSIYGSSFIKFRELSLRYQPIKREKFGLGINFFARNILVWTNNPQLDPESTQGNTNMAGAFERFTLPQTTSFGFGVNLQF
ncbi:SusC/RagA family TonB-linked outer membrane protein [Niabella ginsenosidivorans]|uniref:SusC/RagA family TonB-linked outer membrane protein n=1 Tax=Niabella ginsenosidivorans TaxID=1176587 RepID=A0A1A9I3I6_9BACT|nr:SusC/RagA family TonB-linked outer membrane protein [Niabella ginsenosidivorans]ANH82186.1 SusC/RagA family TonB-linked outer membrane protein [Niabella ginsenosidivorans]